MYELGYYTEDGEPEILSRANTREEARKKYKILHDRYKCTIWVQKIDFINPKDL